MSYQRHGTINSRGLEVLLEQLRDAVGFIDRSGRILLTNSDLDVPATASPRRMSDLSDVFEILHRDGRPYTTVEWPVLRSVSTGEVIIDEEFFRLAPDGSRRSFSCSSAPIYDDDGEIVAAVVVARDVSDQNHAREQLAYLLPMLDHTEDAIIANDAQWHIMAWNMGAERMFGWTAEEAVGRPAMFLQLDESDEQRLERRRQLAEYGRWRGETAISRKDGSKVPVEVVGVAIRDGDGEITGYLGIHRDITERTRAEEALGAATRRAEQILESISDVFFAVDREWRYTYVNQRAVEQAGLEWGREVTAQELLGKSCWELFPDQLGTAYDLQLHRALREQRVVPFEVLSARTGRWAEVRAYPSEDGLSVYSRDIGERKRAEKELREANSRTENILESITDFFVAFDRDWRHTYLNRRVLDGIRQARGEDVALEDLLGKSLWDLNPELVGTTIDLELHRAVREQRTVVFESCSAVTDRWMEMHAYPSEDGGLSVYARDITERKRADEQLAYHASLLDNVEDGVVATDANNFCISAWNKGAERLYGFTAEEVLGRPAREVGSYPGDESRLRLERELLETGGSRIELTAHHKDGTPIEVELVAVAVKGVDGEITGYLGIHRDITERKRAEEALRQANRRSEAILESITDAFVAVDHDWRYTYLNDRALLSTQEWLGWPISREELLGRSLWEVFPETVDSVPHVKYQQAIREGRPVEFETYFAAKDRWFETHVYPSESGLSIYFRTITERKRAEEQLESRLGQQAAVAELGLKALEDGRLQRLMDEAVALVCRTLGVEYAKVDKLLPAGEQLLVTAGAGWTEGVVGSATMPTGHGSPAGYALLMGEPVIVDDMPAETRFEVPSLLQEHEVMSDITVVIDPRGNPFGTLMAASREQRTFSEDDVSFMQSVANVLATAVERAKTDDRLEAVREAERTRVARELHDEGLRELADALGIATVERGDASEPRDKQRWAALIDLLHRAGQQLRGAIYDLRLGTDVTRPFPELLADLVELQSQLPVGCHVELHGRETLPAESLGQRGTEVLRIVREAIINACRHSGAGTVRVDAGRSTDELLHLDVSDDGDWPNREATVSSRQSTGIIGMFERASGLGAALRIEGRSGGGTTVSLELGRAGVE